MSAYEELGGLPATSWWLACDTCGHEFEVSDYRPRPAECPDCAAERRVREQRERAHKREREARR